MYKLETQEMSPEFLKCLQAAGIHIDNQVQGGMKSWLKATPYPPFLEHLSFRLGNQIFFVRVEDEDERIDGPGSRIGLKSIATGCSGHACVLPMKKKLIGGWSAVHSGWGLIDADTGRPVNPIDLVSDEKIEMTAWELQDFAVQVVREQLQKEGFQLMSWQGNPEVDPSIWFVGKRKKPEWIIVRVARHAESEAIKPANWSDIAAGCAHLGEVGHFAPVTFASGDQPFLTSGEAPVPLWRGHGVHVRYQGLEPGETI